MAKNKKAFKLCTAILLMTLLLSGCAGKTPQGQEKTAGTDADKEKVQLLICTPPLLYGKLGGESVENSAYTDFLEYAAAKFAAQYTEADIEYVVRGFDYVDESKVIKDTLGTTDAPDVLFEGFFNMGSYILQAIWCP